MKQFTKAVPSDAVSEREKQNLEIAYRAACEGVVLLENDGALPINVGKVALYGPGAKRTIKGGTGSGEVNERHSVSILEGMQDRGFEITTMKWIDAYEAEFERVEKEASEAVMDAVKKLQIDKIVNIAFKTAQYPAGPAIDAETIAESDTDTCIYVISRQAGEGDDRKLEAGDYYLTDSEKASIKACAQGYDKFILVINCGSPIDMGFMDEIEGINAVMYIAQLGTEGGHAVADLLSGKCSPSGKAVDTWAKKYDDIPYANEYSYLNGNLNDEYYKEGIYVGYRYFDTFNVAPRYEFGYGKSYTDFRVECAGAKIEGTKATVIAKVTNIGNVIGKEVAQLYVSSPNGKLDKEYQALAAFAKTDAIQPQVTQELELSFDLSSIACYDEAEASYILDAGDYIFRLGNSSRNTTVCAVATLESKVVVSKHENICPLTCELEVLKGEDRSFGEIPEGAVKLTVDPAAFSTKTFAYGSLPVVDDERVAKIMKKMSVNDMIDVVVGVGMFASGLKFNMPGSVGNTTDKFWKKGLSNVALCDGPAGLRISRRAALTKKGTIKAVEAPISIFNMMPKFVKNIMFGTKKSDTMLYQFTTAFPVALALAQSWNEALLEEIGNAVGVEVSEYGCTYWLAPALNIHRNPLCGRNFEYFSEDALLSGKMAAAITKGVQSKPGRYVTLKHFALNNQELNRNKVSSNCCERAIREIYLKGFGIAVQEAGAKSVMTAYNRINSVYSPNCYDTCTKVLRNEWGFDGVVMTDWFSTNKGLGNNAVAMHAGNDLIMPGGKFFKKDIKKGLKKGLCTKEDIRRCCANVIKLALDSETQKEYIG